jgi:hemoglobin
MHDSPFHSLGGEDVVRKLATRFYDHMDASEPELAKIHDCDEKGAVSARTRERFTRFLIEWLGGPTVYSPVEGHPRLRMRHGHVAIDEAMRDAWLRCMSKAMDDIGATGEVRQFLDGRFAEVANFLRNR